jgi:hypothetical protein
LAVGWKKLPMSKRADPAGAGFIDGLGRGCVIGLVAAAGGGGVGC